MNSGKAGRKHEAIGGQALIEGVMLRQGSAISTAISKGDKIKVRKYTRVPLSERNAFFRLPFVRGVVSLFDMLYIGMKEMIYSANEASDDGSGEKIGKGEVFLSITLSLIFALALFKLLPLGAAKAAQSLHLIGDSRFVFNLLDGLMRLLVFILYIYAISFVPDIKRVFQYHGAEHKAVHCYEQGLKLTVQNVKKHTTLHKRCGTSFIFIVLFFSILIFSIVPVDQPFYLLFFYRLPLLLPIAGVSYEVLRLSARFDRNAILSALVWPGVLLQKITTAEPDNRQIEVAISALKAIKGRQAHQHL